jgi:hypothetical protein
MSTETKFAPTSEQSGWFQAINDRIDTKQSCYIQLEEGQRQAGITTALIEWTAKEVSIRDRFKSIVFLTTGGKRCCAYAAERMAKTMKRNGTEFKISNSEQIETKNAKIRFFAAANDKIRGISCDLVVVDQAVEEYAKNAKVWAPLEAMEHVLFITIWSPPDRGTMELVQRPAFYENER